MKIVGYALLILLGCSGYASAKTYVCGGFVEIENEKGVTKGKNYPKAYIIKTQGKNSVRVAQIWWTKEFETQVTNVDETREVLAGVKSQDRGNGRFIRLQFSINKQTGDSSIIFDIGKPGRSFKTTMTGTCE